MQYTLRATQNMHTSKQASHSPLSHLQFPPPRPPRPPSLLLPLLPTSNQTIYLPCTPPKTPSIPPSRPTIGTRPSNNPLRLHPRIESASVSPGAWLLMPFKVAARVVDVASEAHGFPFLAFLLLVVVCGHEGFSMVEIVEMCVEE